MYSWCSPCRIGGCHSLNELPNLSTHCRTSRPLCLRQSPPILFESFALPRDDRFGPHDDQSGFPILPNRPQRNPKQSIPTVQPRACLVSLENGQLLTECHIFQSDMSVTAQYQNEEPNCDENSIQHETATVPSSDERIKYLMAHRVLAEDK